MYAVTAGIVLAFPSVLSPAILSNNGNDIEASLEEVSWISACQGLSGILGFVILSPMFQTIGRKTVNIITNAIVLIGWIIFYFANNVTSLICARLVQGLAIGGVFIVAVTLSENSHPSRRGYFMSLKKVSIAIGSLVCHTLGLIWTWKQIAMFSAILQVLSLLLVCPCPESPAYLAMKGRFDECSKTFRWLFGQSTEAEQDLKDLISAQMKNIDKNIKFKSNKCLQMKETLKNLLKKDFQTPFYIVVLATLAGDACGRYFMFAYIIQIMMEVTKDKSHSMYCTIAVDCLLIFSLAISCFLIKKYERRTLILRLGFSSAFLMLLICLTAILRFYLVAYPILFWIAPGLILLHTFISHIGLVPVTFAIVGEIFPLEYKGLGSFATGIVFTVFYFLTLKLTPLMIDRIGIEGTYGIYGLCVFICLMLLYFYLPETKDRTLQDIEDEIRGEKRNAIDVQSVLINGGRV